MARELGMGTSEVHAAVGRGEAAGLIDRVMQEPNRGNLHEFLLHGIKYAFPAVRGPLTHRMPTAHAVPPVSERMGVDPNPPVWPDPNRSVRGESFIPLYRSAIIAAMADGRLYRLLALIDCLHGGRAHVKTLAAEFLNQELNVQPQSRGH